MMEEAVATVTLLDEAVERVAAARPCPECEGTWLRLPDELDGLACLNCRGDGSLDGHQVIRAVLEASGLLAEARPTESAAAQAHTGMYHDLDDGEQRCAMCHRTLAACRRGEGT